MARKMKEISRNIDSGKVIGSNLEPHAQTPGSVVLSNSVCFTEDKNKNQNLKVNMPVIYVAMQTAKHPSDIKGFYLQLSVPESDSKYMPSFPSLRPVPILRSFKKIKKERNMSFLWMVLSVVS